MLLDDSLKTDIEGSAYWVESALLAFINTSLTFTDEGFIELSLWTETSSSGEPNYSLGSETWALSGRSKIQGSITHRSQS